MFPDRVSNPGPLTYESGALPIAIRGPALDDKAATHNAMLQIRRGNRSRFCNQPFLLALSFVSFSSAIWLSFMSVIPFATQHLKKASSQLLYFAM